MQWLAQRFAGLLVVGAIIGVVALGAAVVNYFTPNVWIYVDNPTTTPMQVVVDGQPLLVVAPGAHDVVKTFAGTKKIEVLHGGQSLFSESRLLAAGGPHRYLLCPSDQMRYGTHTVAYGMVIPQLPASSAESAYREAAKEIKLLPTAAWLDIDSCQHVFEPAPAEIQVSQHEFMASRTVLDRILPADYDVLAAAPTKANVTLDDLRQLTEIIEHVVGQ